MAVNKTLEQLILTTDCIRIGQPFRAADPLRAQPRPAEQAGFISQKTRDATEIATLPETGQSLIGRVVLRSISAERL